MSDVQTPAGPGTPAPAPVAPVTPPVVPAAPVATPVTPPAPAVPPAAAAPPELDPTWLNGRLARSKEQGAKDLLATIGAETPEQAKAAIAAAKAAEDAAKTAEQRAAEARTRAQQLEADNARSSALIREQASRMMMVLTAEQQKAVTDFAGDNPAEQLRAIQHFAPLWSAKAQQAVAEQVTATAPVATPPAPGAPPVAAPPPALPATTSPPPAAPPSASPGAPPNHRAQYEQLAQTNPFAAAAYGLENFSAVHVPKT